MVSKLSLTKGGLQLQASLAVFETQIESGKFCVTSGSVTVDLGVARITLDGFRVALKRISKFTYKFNCQPKIVK